MRVLPPVLYGSGHPYAIPFSGSGTEESIAALQRQDLVEFQQQVLRPDNVTIIVTGAVTLESIVPLLENHFGNWTRPQAPNSRAGPFPPPRPRRPRTSTCSTGRARSSRRSSSAS